MKSYETFSIVQPEGDVNIPSVPFAPGTEVEVSISAKRRSAGEFAEAWNRIGRELRDSPNAVNIREDDVAREVDDYRAGR